jgi:hypothetical protein
MASVKKFTNSAVRQQLRHNSRETLNPSNSDIDPSRSQLNYKLSPNRKFIDKHLTDYEYYKLRLSCLHVFNRADVKTMAGWLVTAPKCLAVEKHQIFFQEVYNFLENRYGKQDIVQAIVHNDETTPHLHFLFIPAVKDAKNRKPSGEKVCANDVLTRQELRTFHPALQEHLNRAGIDAKILNGATAAGNRTVAEMKRERDLTHNREVTRGVFLER